MLFKRLRDLLLTVKQAIFRIISGGKEKKKIITDRYMAEEDCEHSMFSDLRDN